MTVRVLTLDDYEALAELSLSRSAFLGVDPERLEIQRKFATANMKDLLTVGQSYGTAFGLFNAENTLVAAIITLVSTNQPAYFLNKAFTAPGTTISALPELFNAMIVHYEGLGYKRFFTMYKSSLVDVYQRLWRCTDNLKGYISYTELDLDAQERPKHADIWELLSGRQLYVDPMSVRGFIKLDNNYRIWE